MTSGTRLLARVAPYASLIRGISHPYRIAILHILSYEPTWVDEIARRLGVHQNLVMHHLKAMQAAGWLKKKREGKRVLYSLNKKAVKQVSKFFVGTPFWLTLTKQV